MKRSIFTALIFFCPLMTCLRAQSAEEKSVIWIDTDMLFGKMKKDVDDGLALLMALNDGTVNIAGISLVDQTGYGKKITGEFLKWQGVDKEIPVFEGANRPFAMGEKTDAVEGLAAALRKQKLTVVGLGPAVNIAAVLLHYPELKDSVAQVILCMGRQPGAHFNPGSGKKNLNDYNFDLAPDAAEVILNSGVPVALCGYEASASVYLQRDDYRFFREGGRQGKKIYRRLKRWSLGWKLFLGSKIGFIPFDAVTLTYVLRPDLLTAHEDTGVEILPLKNDTHFKNFGDEKKYLLASAEFKDPHKAIFCSSAQPEIKNFILELLQKSVESKYRR